MPNTMTIAPMLCEDLPEYQLSPVDNALWVWRTHERTAISSSSSSAFVNRPTFSQAEMAALLEMTSGS